MEIIAIEIPEAGNREDVIKMLSEVLVKRGNAEKELPKAILERERQFPTGLKLKLGVNVAIPHANAKYIRRPAIVVTKLHNPVKFLNMEDRREIYVNIIFLLALNDPRSQIHVLQKLASMLQNEEMVLKLKSARDSEELANLLKKELSKEDRLSTHEKATYQAQEGKE